MKHRIRYLVTAAVVSVGLSSAASAAPMGVNTINFAGSAQFDQQSLATATTIEEWFAAFNNTLQQGVSYVQTVEGAAFTNHISVGQQITLASPWVFTSALNDLWAVGGFSFDLESATIHHRSDAFINISGTGVVSGNGYDPTPATWFFTANMPSNGRFAYSAGSATVAAVPDGGSAIALLGLALGGLELLRRRRKVVGT
jgi:hypothetical protein